MKAKETKFKNLRKEFRKLGMSVDEVAEATNFPRCILYNRLSGKTKWTLDDILTIQQFVNKEANANYSIDYLFEIGG